MESLLEFLEQEREKLFRTASSLQELLGSLAETLRTLAGPLRNSFASSATIRSALKPDGDRLTFIKPELQSLDGEVQNNTARLIGLINNLYAIRNRHLASPYFIEFTDLAEIEQVQAEIKRFLEELFAQNAAALESRSESSALARQKKRDIEEILETQAAPWFQRLRQIKTDEFVARLRPELKENIESSQAYARQPQAYENLIKDKCSLAGLPFDPQALQVLMSDFDSGDEHFEKKIRDRYAEPSAAPPLSPEVLRRKYLRILSRYIAALRDLERLEPVLQQIYYLFQPRPGLLRRLGVFFARLAGREKQIPRRDIEFTYITSRENIQRRKASLEAVMDRANVLEKSLLRLKASLRRLPAGRMEAVIDRLHPELAALTEDGTGLIQWLGKAGNREKLKNIPEASQRTLHLALTSLQATVIINQERLQEIAHKEASSGL